MNFTEAARYYQQYKSCGVVTDVASDDVMYNSGQDWYFYVGESAINAVLSALTLSRLSAVKSVLDLPCGHGRVARHLRAAFPSAELAVYCRRQT